MIKKTSYCTPFELFAESSRINSKRIAVKTKDKEYSYESLKSLVDTVAGNLVECFSVTPSNKPTLLISTTNSVDRVILLLSAMKIGIPYIPISHNMPESRLKKVIESLENVDGILCSDDYFNDLKKQTNTPIHKISSLLTITLNQKKSNIKIDNRGDENNVLYVLFTSGTTGVPKGIKIANKAYTSHYLWFQKEFGFTKADTWLHTIDSSFDPSIDELLVPLCTGGSIAMLGTDTYDVYNNIEALYRFSATFLTCVPSTLKLLVQACENVEVKDLKTIIVGGEKFDHELAMQCRKILPGINVHNVYGPTETTISIASYKLNDSMPNRVPIGYPGDNVEFFLKDLDSNVIKSSKDIDKGELCVTGDALALGYLNNEEKTNQSFIQFTDKTAQDDQKEKTAYLTGDVVSVDSDGLFYYEYRIDEQIKINGIRVEIGEINTAIASCDGIEECFTFLHEGKVNACVIKGDTTDITENSIREHLNGELHQALIPNHIHIVKTMPLKSTGKVDKQALIKDMDSSRKYKKEKIIKNKYSKSHVYQKIENTVKSVLNQQKSTSIDPNVAFQDLGINSLQIQRLCMLLNNSLDLNLKTSDLFDAVNLKGLFNLITRPNRTKSPRKAVKLTMHQRHHDKQSKSISIIGISCQLGCGVKNVNEFRRVLHGGKNLVNQLSNNKIVVSLNKKTEHSKLGCYIEESNYSFDHGYFGISFNEAKKMDPQHRLMLQQVIHALEDAGIKPNELHEKKVGVFVGLTNNDHVKMVSNNKKLLDGLIGRGSVAAMASGRISYFLGCTGPSLVIDTACSSGLTALHLGKQSLLNNECDIAIITAANLILTNDFNVDLASAGMLAKDGKCKSFSEHADGFARAEGAAAIILKKNDKENDCLAYANIISSANNCDGRSNGVTAPSGKSQTALLTESLDKADLSPDDINFVEAHGTGTVLGDEIEASSLKNIFRDRQHPLYLGSAKANVGHTEAAAGLIGVIKSVLSISENTAFKHPYAESENKKLELETFNAILPNKNETLSSDDDKRIYGMVSSFGVSGNNVNVILGSIPLQEKRHSTMDPNFDSEKKHEPCILLLSAKTKQALQEYISNYINFIAENKTKPLDAICSSHNESREHFSQHRAYVVGQNHDEIISQLNKLKEKNYQRA